MRKKENNYVYSLRITKEEHKLLKDHKELKQDLNRYVKEYLKVFLEQNKKS